MDIKLIVMGKKVEENKIHINGDTRYWLKINDTLIEDITYDMLSNFNFTMSTFNTLANFELKSGEVFQNIKIEFHFIEDNKNPHMVINELGIPVFIKHSGKSSREMYNEDKNSSFESLYEDGKELRELLFADMTDDEVRNFINKSINEYRKGEK